MNAYHPAMPRTALGALAFALTIVTFGLFVAAPAALAAHDNYVEACTTGAYIATASAPEAVRTLPAVAVVASRSLQG